MSGTLNNIHRDAPLSDRYWDNTTTAALWNFQKDTVFNVATMQARQHGKHCFRKYLPGILLLFSFTGANAMGFTKVLFSRVHGVVLNHGNPVPNAVVTRHFNFGWTDEEKTENTKTDKDGAFYFPSIKRFSLTASVLPHEPSVSQIIKIHHNGKEYIAWHLNKHNYDENGELGGRPISLICELTDEPTTDSNTLVSGICTIK